MMNPNWKQAAKQASRSLSFVSDASINKVLLRLAEEIQHSMPEILSANSKDLDRMASNDPMYDRLKLSPERLESIAADIRQVAALPSPLGKILHEYTRPNGLKIQKISVPFGVIAVIYEARPNVTFDVFALCLKSGNACILKGGSSAQESNKAIVEVIRLILKTSGLNPDIITLLPAGHEATEELLRASDTVDALIPRGGKGLINYVRQHAQVPIIETGAGVCHTFFDASGDIEKGKAIILNAKTRRVSVCNALDCLIVHKERLHEVHELVKNLADKSVLIYADAAAYAELYGKYPKELLEKASQDSFGCEFLDYKMAIKTVSSLFEAVEHIHQYGSKHSECIISQDPESIRYFSTSVDAACVYSNASTAFTDGGQFGFGAEIGISTQKLHARGPMALPELCSYKWIISGDGQVRE